MAVGTRGVISVRFKSESRARGSYSTAILLKMRCCYYLLVTSYIAISTDRAMTMADAAYVRHLTR